MHQSLWDFSVALYARPGVAELCLQLQDELGADVCLLLAALWLEQRAVAATAERVAQLEQLATPWQAEVTTPLRQLRRAWKTAAAGDAGLAELRRQLAALELQAERLLLERVGALSARWPADAAAASNWLECLAGSGDPPGRLARQQLREAARAMAHS